MTENIIFSSYDHAYSYLNIPRDEVCVKMVEHEKSLNRTTYNNKNIFFVGIGREKFPGYPNTHQSWIKQKPLIDKFATDGYIRVFTENVLGIRYLGVYVYSNYVKKMANNGFIYFEYKLTKRYHQF